MAEKFYTQYFPTNGDRIRVFDEEVEQIQWIPGGL